MWTDAGDSLSGIFFSSNPALNVWVSTEFEDTKSQVLGVTIEPHVVLFPRMDIKSEVPVKFLFKQLYSGYTNLLFCFSKEGPLCSCAPLHSEEAVC